MEFVDVEISDISFLLCKEEDNETINILYRGRFEIDGVLFEKTSLNKVLFYIEFESGSKINVFCSKAFLSV